MATAADAAKHTPLRLVGEAVVRGEARAGLLLPWLARLSSVEQRRLREDLAVVLAEPEVTGEPLDEAAIQEILQEAAELVGWDGPLLQPEREPATAGPYRVSLSPQDEERLATAPPAVQRMVAPLLAEFLPRHPTAGEFLPRGRLKKLKNRELWQVGLPDGYRLRYFVDEEARTVTIIYLGPHPDHGARGREQQVRARAHLRRHGAE